MVLFYGYVHARGNCHLDPGYREPMNGILYHRTTCIDCVGCNDYVDCKSPRGREIERKGERKDVLKLTVEGDNLTALGSATANHQSPITCHQNTSRGVSHPYLICFSTPYLM